MTGDSLPPFAPFPDSGLRQRLPLEDRTTLVEGWTLLARAWSGLSDGEFKLRLKKDESAVVFAKGFVTETAEAKDTDSLSSTHLLKAVWGLISRIFSASTDLTALIDFNFLSGLARIYPPQRASTLLATLTSTASPVFEATLTTLTKELVPHMEAGINGNLKLVQSRLSRLNLLLRASPYACTLLLAGSDFFDALVLCFRVMNPPLRKIIVTTVYLSLVGLTELEPPKWAMLSDQLYMLTTAAETHRTGPLNANDSLVAEVVTSTPLLRTLMKRAEAAASSPSLKNRITELETYKKGPLIRPRRKKVDKGKGKADGREEMHIHRMSQVTQIQDLFPDLGSGFVSRCLDEYRDDVEQVVANLLAETLPPHLASADRTELLSSSASHPDLAPSSTPPTTLPSRRNIFDDDDFDRLAVDTSKLSFGKSETKTADDLLHDRSSAPAKASILSALAAFDSDDDERDDTYDAADVGGVVDSTNQEADGAADGREEALFRAYQMDARSFARDAATRRGKTRSTLRDDTGMTDEAIEGWAVMLARNPAQMKRLEAKYAFAGQQDRIERTAWRADGEDEESGSGSGQRGGGRGRGRGRGGGGGRGRGDVAGPTGERSTEQARRRKEASKGSRANHNRREGRARKMARGGFPG